MVFVFCSCTTSKLVNKIGQMALTKEKHASPTDFLKLIPVVTTVIFILLEVFTFTGNLQVTKILDYVKALGR